MTRLHKLPVPVAVIASAAMLMPQVTEARPTTMPFKDARLKIEVNATDGDAGFQLFVDADPWRSITLYHADGRRIADVETKRVLKDFGLTELFSESSEPPFDELPYEEFLKLYPEGQYRLKGRTIDGKRLESTITFTHDVLDAPVITSPADGATVPETGAVVTWNPATGPRGVELASYHVIVTREDPKRITDIDLPADVTSFAIPTEFLEPGVEYKIELHALSASGNQIFTEVGFTVG